MIFCIHCKTPYGPIQSGDNDVWECPDCENRVGFNTPEQIPYTNDEISVILNAINIYGGNFMKAIGRALSIADSKNQDKIYHMWGLQLQKYFEMGGGEK
jgi:hypothetical protein